MNPWDSPRGNREGTTPRERLLALGGTPSVRYVSRTLTLITLYAALGRRNGDGFAGDDTYVYGVWRDKLSV